MLFMFGIAVFAVQILVRKTRRPLRLQYRLQWVALLCACCGLIVFGLHAFRKGFGWKDLIAPLGFLIMAGSTGISLYRLRPKVLIEQPKSPVAAPITLPKMLWPVGVVLLPLAVLASMAAWTLVKDRRSAQDEAKARAGEIAAALLSTAEEDLRIVEFRPNGYAIMKGQNTITVNELYELTNPRPWVWPPQPAPLTANDFASLKTNKLTQWREAEAAFNAGQWTNAVDRYLKFLDGRRQLGAEPMADFHAGIASTRFRPIALSKRAAALERMGDVPGAIAAYNDLFGGFVLGQSGYSESGVPFAPIAVLKILDLAKDNPAALPDDWRRNPQFVVSELAQDGDISPITEEAIRHFRKVAPTLIANSTMIRSTDELFDLWDRSVRAREGYAEALARMGTHSWPENFWINGSEPLLLVKQKPPDDWLQFQLSKSTAPHHETIYAMLSRNWLFRQLADHAGELDRRGDFVVVADIAGEKFSLSASSAAEGAVQATEAQQLQAQHQPISLSCALRDPHAYFQAAQRRQMVFASLIFGALLAGLASAIVLRRSLLRQQTLNDQKSNFVSSVSHELRAPIASVRLMAESLERGKVAEGEKQNEYFRFIVQECRRLSSLIENVLDFSRIEQGRKQYEFEPTDLFALTRETVKLMEPYAEEKGVQLKLETPPATPERSEGGNIEVEVDGRAIQQALVNLIDNAIKHSAKGQAVTIGLDAEQSALGVSPKPESPFSSKAQLPVLLYVEDHGSGIPPAEHEKIFERFYRLGSELRRETQGVGIGLSIVRHIVEAHGGIVTVRSNTGEGSRFTIVLPVLNAKTQGSGGAKKL